MDINDTVFIDLNTQNDFLDIRGTRYVPQGTRIRRNLARLMNTAQEKNITVVSIMNTHVYNDPEFETFNAHCLFKTWGWEKIPETKISDFKFRFHKFRLFETDQIVDSKEDKKIKVKSSKFTLLTPKDSPFSNLNTMNIIRKIDKKTFVLFGVPIEPCIEAMALELLRNKFTVYIVEDAVLGYNENHSVMALQELVERGVKLLKTSKVIIELGKQEKNN